MGNASREEYDDAAILTRYLDVSSMSTNWDLETWSKDNAPMAGLLWPRVQDLAVHEMYFAIPELIQKAISSKEPSEFQSVADRLLKTASAQQLGYWMSRQRDNESDVRLLRLIDWLERSRDNQAEIASFEMQDKLDDLIAKAKIELGDTLDINLPGEEVVASN